MNIIEKIKALNFPDGEYVVIGSCIMDVLEIRKAKDIDIAITSFLHNKLRQEGEWNEVERYGLIFLQKDVFEITPRLDWEKYKTTTKEAILTSTIIDGIPFMNLDELCKFKSALGREKDLIDIKLIKKYQDNLK